MTNPFGALWRRARIEWRYHPMLSRPRRDPPAREGGEYVPSFDNSLPKGRASYGPGAKHRRRLTDWRKPKPGPSGEWHSRR